jgi:hypothetical protein
MTMSFKFYKGDMAIGELYDTFKGNDGDEAGGFGDREDVEVKVVRCI